MTKSKDAPNDTNALAVIDMNFDGNVFHADFDAMEMAARAYAEQFDNLPIVTEDDRKEAKKIHGDINSKIREIDSARIAMYREYDKPKAPFTEKCNSIIAILREQAKYIDDGLKRKDAEFHDHREALLLQEYEAAAKELMPHIPLDVFTVKEPKLLGRTWGDVKACNTLLDMIETAVSDRKTIKASCQEFHVEADIAYCKTLNLSAALDHHRNLVESRRELDEHERRMRDVSLVDEPKPEPAPISKPAQPAYPTPAKRKSEPLQSWSFDFIGTRTQAEQLAKCAREIGVTSDGIKARKSK